MHRRGAGTRAAGIGLAHTSLKYAQFHFIPGLNLHKPHINPLREAHMSFKEWSKCADRRRISVIDHQNRMGIAHR